MSIQDDIETLRAALAAGPSPGPWTVYGGTFTRGTITAPGGHVCALTSRKANAYQNSTERTKEQMMVDARYIAACEPERIRRLLEQINQEASPK